MPSANTKEHRVKFLEPEVMPPFPPQSQHRSSQNQQPPVNPQNPPKHLAHRGGTSGHKPRLLVRRSSGDGRPGEWIDVDRERRSRNRGGSTPPDNRHHHPAAVTVDHRHQPTQDGQTGFASVSANESLAWGQHWVNTWWNPSRTEVQVQVGGQWVVRGGRELREGLRGHGEDDDNRGRGRRSSDAKHAPPTPAPAPRRMPTPSPSDSSPVIPGIPATGAMGFRNLLQKRSRHRPKILFYHKHQPHYGFTNFSPHAVMYGGKRYPTSEHLFQSLKFIHKPNLMEHIRTCDPRPSVAFAEARRFAQEVDPNWKHTNINAMDTTLYHKFTQHQGLKRELLATGDAELIENSDKDSFWGCGADGKGRNELGKALERLRKLLREQERR